MRVARTVHERLARADAVAFLNVDVHAARQRVLAHIRAVIRDDEDLAESLDDAAVPDGAGSLTQRADATTLSNSLASRSNGIAPASLCVTLTELFPVLSPKKNVGVEVTPKPSARCSSSVTLAIMLPVRQVRNAGSFKPSPSAYATRDPSSSFF